MMLDPNELSVFNPFIRVINFNECPRLFIPGPNPNFYLSNFRFIERLASFFKFTRWRKMNTFQIFIPRIRSFFKKSFFMGTFQRTIFFLGQTLFFVKFFTTNFTNNFFTCFSTFSRTYISRFFEKIRFNLKFLITCFTECFHTFSVSPEPLKCNDKIEKEEEYCEIARKRIAAAKEPDPELFDI